jgi:hypothetical protein
VQHLFACNSCKVKWQMETVPIPPKQCDGADEESACCRLNPEGFMWPVDCCPKCHSLHFTWLTYDADKT